MRRIKMGSSFKTIFSVLSNDSGNRGTYLYKPRQDDYSDLCKILQDETVIYAYEHVFPDEEVRL